MPGYFVSKKASRSTSTDRLAVGETLAWLANTADGVFAVDGRQQIIFWSDSAQRILGWTAGEVLGRRCYEVVAGGDYEGQRFCRRNCPTIANTRRGRPTSNYDVQTRTKDGRKVWINVSIVVLRLHRRRSPLALHLFRDVTRRRRLERVAQAAVAALQGLPSGEEGVGRDWEPCPGPLPQLTRRETEVLRLLACGVSTREIAQSLSVSYITARNHVANILAKLGVANRLQAVIYASRHRLL